MRIRESESVEEFLSRAKAAIARFEDYPITVRPAKRLNQPPVERLARGVYELQFAPPGRRAFHLVASDGNVGYVDLPDHWVNRDFVKNLWKRLDREDPPRPHLELIHRDA